jgi:hypothetical protein
MAKTIPQLTDATTVNAADELIIQQGGITKRATAAELMNNAPVTVTSTTTARPLAARFSDVVNVKDFGAVGDGLADDTAAIQAAINAAQDLVQGRFRGGAVVFIPAGTYLITSTLNISEGDTSGIAGGINGTGRNNVELAGSGFSSTVLRTPMNSAFDVISFGSGISRDFYGAGVRDLTIGLPGNTTGGCAIRMTNCTDAFISNVIIDGWYDAIVIDSSLRVFISNIITNQRIRNAGVSRFALDIAATYSNSGGVHVSDYNFAPTGNTAADYSFVVRGVDGLYCTNGHQYGGILFSASNASNIMASAYFNNVYFDTANVANVRYIGSGQPYKGHRYISCYFRNATNAAKIETSGTLEFVQFVGCHFSQQSDNGVWFVNTNANKFLFDSCLFDQNNRDDVSNNADLLLRGDGHIVSNSLFSDGSAVGRNLWVTSQTTNSNISGCNFANSTAGTPLLNNSVTSSMSNLVGVTAKASGVATIANGANSVTVSHGIDVATLSGFFTPDKLSVTPTNNLGGITWWISSLNNLSFVINTSSNVTADSNFAWVLDLTK